MGLLLLATACEKEIPVNGNLKDVQFNATIEPLEGSDTKVYLFQEQFVLWELGDQISIGSDLTIADESPAVGDLVSASPGSDFENFNGVFLAPLPENSGKFLGLHPVSSGNRIIGSGAGSADFAVTLDMPAEQPRRPGEKEDLTFAKQVYPMVAWYGGTWDPAHPTPYNLDFRSLGCILRVQLYNATASAATLKDITFTSRLGSGCMQLSGPFTIGNYNIPEPYLTPKASPSAEEQQVKLTFGSGLTFNTNDLKTFYLVLPAIAGEGVTTTYKLTMEVKADVGGDEKTFSMDLTAKTRRRGVTNMRAVGVTDWTSTPPDTVVTLAGNGTKDRPFKVYTIDDLLYLRSCYNDTTPGTPRTINRQPITKDTYIHLMRTDIVLTTANWNSSSIENFAGHFVDASSNASHGITNNSNIPLFEDITSKGHVENLVLKSGASLSGSASFLSPFCNINRGEIKNCRLSGTVSATYADLGGIVGQNLDGGTIKGCACEANLSVSSGKHIGGICLDNANGLGNESVVSGCYVSATSALTMTGAEIGGICHDNQGTVQDCYFSATINAGGDANWGGIVYKNSATVSKVEHCYLNGSITTTGTVGGIVHTVSSGTVDYCWLAKYVKGSQAGGIAHTVSGGKVINCYTDNSEAQILVDVGSGTHIGGGIVAIVSGGEVTNSYVYTLNINGSSATLGGFVGRLTGGIISNSYAQESHTGNFYGSTTLSGTALTTTLGGTTPCYLIGYSQEGVSDVASPGSGLASILTANKPSGGASWSGIPPTLDAYGSTKGRK